MSSATPTGVGVVTSVQRRRRWTPEQKLEIIKQTNEPGNSVSMAKGPSVRLTDGCGCQRNRGASVRTARGHACIKQREGELSRKT
jgi:hypothetical protein